MIDTKTEERIVYKLANKESHKKISEDLGISNMPVFRVSKEHKDKIHQKTLEIKKKARTLNEKILFYAKDKLLSQLKAKKSISENILANVIRAVDTIKRLDENKPTAISGSKKDYAQMTDKELENETKRLVNTIRSNTERGHQEDIPKESIPA